jgi:hypothetical protein
VLRKLGLIAFARHCQQLDSGGPTGGCGFAPLIPEIHSWAAELFLCSSNWGLNRKIVEQSFS